MRSEIMLTCPKLAQLGGPRETYPNITTNSDNELVEGCSALWHWLSEFVVISLLVQQEHEERGCTVCIAAGDEGT